MKKIFLEELPKWKNGRYKEKINWKDGIGHKVNFTYGNIKGKIEIVDYYKENKKYYLKIKYKLNVYSINISNFTNCQLGNILGINTSKYKYQVGDIITDVRSGKLKILEQIRIKNGKNTQKGYKYKCLICGNKDIISEYDLKKHNGCNVCCIPPRKILVGYNDIWTTNPRLAKLLADPNDGYRHTQNSSVFTNWECPNCNNIIEHKRIEDINKDGLSCPKCSDGVSMPEKIMFNILKQLNVNFIYQLTKKIFNWIKNNYRYDFYFKINNKEYIIEMDGKLGHGNEDNPMSGQTKEESKAIDDYKDKLAREYNIEIIRIDCKKSELKYIKDKILKSELNDIFDLSNIDWIKVGNFVYSSFMKEACDLWNKYKYSTNKIGKMLNLCEDTIRKYLKQGNELGWCYYNAKEIQKQNGEIFGCKGTKIICLNNKKVFNSIEEAKRYLNKSININYCCKNKTKFAGVDSITGEYLQWQYYDEYLIKPKKLLTNDEIINNYKYNKKQIICLNNNRVFNSMSDIHRKYKISTSNICNCCKGMKKSAGKDPITNESLHWMYYEDYLKLESENKIVNE